MYIMQRILITLTTEQREALANLKVITGMPVASLIRTAVHEYLVRVKETTAQELKQSV